MKTALMTFMVFTLGLASCDDKANKQPKLSQPRKDCFHDRAPENVVTVYYHRTRFASQDGSQRSFKDVEWVEGMFVLDAIAGAGGMGSFRYRRAALIRGAEVLSIDLVAHRNLPAKEGDIIFVY